MTKVSTQNPSLPLHRKDTTKDRILQPLITRILEKSIKPTFIRGYVEDMMYIDLSTKKGGHDGHFALPFNRHEASQ